MDYVNQWGQTKQKLTSIYHPQTNGQTERMNRILCDVLSKYVSEDQKDWDELIVPAMWAYNTAVQESTGFSPFMMLHGWEPRKQIHSLLLKGHRAEKEQGITQHAKLLEYINKTAYAKETLAKSKQAVQYNKRKRKSQIKAGSVVRYRTHRIPTGLKAKLYSSFKGPYQVFKQLSDVLFYIRDKDKIFGNPVHVQDLKLVNEPFRAKPILSELDLPKTAALED